MSAIYQTAIITGATGEIGSQLTEWLAQRYQRLLIIARNEAKLNQLIERGKEWPCKLDYLVMDLHRPNQAAIQHYVDQYGVDLLINCAGITYYGTADITDVELTEMVQLNLLAPIALTKQVLPQMQRQAYGDIITLVSRSAKFPRSSMGGYAATQFGLSGYFKALNQELIDSSIRATCICPGWVATELTTSVLPNVAPSAMIPVTTIVDTVAMIIATPAKVIFNDILLEPKIQAGKYD